MHTHAWEPVLKSRPADRRSSRRPMIHTVEAVVMIHEIVAAADAITAALDPFGTRIMRNDAQMRMLRVLSRSFGCLSISEVGRRLRVSRQAAHNIVVAAARSGLIRLGTNPHDRRLIQIELTKQGLGELAAADALERRCAITLLNGLETRRMRSTSHILRTLRQRLERARQTPSRER